MRQVHSISISIFIKPEDDYEKEKDIFLSVFPFSLIDEKIELKETIAKGFNERKIRILELTLKKDRHNKLFLEHLNNKFSQEQKGLILRQTNRLDDNCHFFIRLDKDKLKNKEFFLTDSGNCIHLNLSIATFPKNKDDALTVVREIFK